MINKKKSSFIVKKKVSTFFSYPIDPKKHTKNICFNSQTSVYPVFLVGNNHKILLLFLFFRYLTNLVNLVQLNLYH